MINDWEMKLCRFCKKTFCANKNGLCDNCDAKVIAFRIAKFLLTILFLGSIVMFIIGILGIVGALNINLGGSISMVVIGTIFGILPFIKNNIRGVNNERNN